MPLDDGACDHLLGMQLPSVPLTSASSRIVDLVSLPGRTVVYLYPLTGKPDLDLPEGWDEIPGASGCTPQSCGFRDHHKELQALGAGFLVLAHKAQNISKRQPILHLPFELLSDSELNLMQAL